MQTPNGSSIILDTEARHEYKAGKVREVKGGRCLVSEKLLVLVL